ncbi:sulfotransferase domain-containing protein [Candidatus Dojkabacteria bacterium]|jgi:hypothetical protein|nr:sulfotransferase domain-containing protein [Candidatus Dojkabacteria bacterium]
MLNQILICGYPGSGTRVVSQILEDCGYNIGEVNDCYDYMPFLKKNFKNLKSLKNEQEPWALKHGQIMIFLKRFRKRFPDAKIILVYRNGVDNILNGFNWREKYLKKYYKKEGNIGGMEVYCKAHKFALKHVDYVIKLEDLVYRKLETLDKLFKYIGVEANPAKYDCLIKKPDSMGRRNTLDYKELKTLEKMYDKVEHWCREFAERGF